MPGWAGHESIPSEEYFMKPITDKITAPCAHCGKEFSHEVYFRIDGHGYPDLKKKVLDYSAFVSPCPSCMGLSSVPQDFRYFDEVADTRYMIYYFPRGAEAQLEDIIAATLCLRDNGTRVHIIHSLNGVVPIMQAYESGNKPEEQLFKVGDAAMVRAKAQSLQVAHSMNKMIDAMKANSETGKFPDGFIEQIKRGQKIRARQERKSGSKPSFWRKVFGG